MKMILSLFPLLAALTVSCSKVEAGPVETSVKIALSHDLTPAPQVLSGSQVTIYQNSAEGTTGIKTTVSAAGGTNSASTVFKQSKGESYSYFLISPSASVQNPSYTFVTSQAASTKSIPQSLDPLYAYIPSGVSDGSKTSEMQATWKRYGAVVDVTIDGLGTTTRINSTEITFPCDAFAKVTFDPATGSVSGTESASRTIKITGAASSFLFRTLPLNLKKDDKIVLKINTSLCDFTDTVSVEESIVLSDGAHYTIGIHLNPIITFTNPVMRKGWADPTIWYDEGTFYTTATGGNHTINTSTDLVTWTENGNKAQSNAAKTAMKALATDFWAPDVVKVGDKWNMYLSLVNPKNNSAIGVFQSNTAAGPFEFVRRLTFSGDTGIGDTIDPDVVRDPETGKLWMFFGSTNKMHRVQLEDDGLNLVENAKYIHVAGVNVSTNSARNKVFEAAYLYYREGWWYLFASAAQYWNYTYKVVVGRSRSLEGEFVDRNGLKVTEGNATVVISSANGDTFYGPGHNSEIFTDSRGQDYILYHCHNFSVASNSDTRYLCLQRLFWDDEGWPYVQGGKPAEKDIAPLF